MSDVTQLISYCASTSSSLTLLKLLGGCQKAVNGHKPQSLLFAVYRFLPKVSQHNFTTLIPGVCLQNYSTLQAIEDYCNCDYSESNEVCLHCEETYI